MFAKILLLLLSTSCSLSSGSMILTVSEGDPLESLTDEKHERVKSLFTSFRVGSLEDKNRPPKLTWQDVEGLMIMAQSERRLTNFPRNPLSSQAQREAAEGVVALWLIEQLRSDERYYHSLNPLCLAKNGEGNFEAQTRANFPELLEAYQAWWEKASKVDEAAAKEIDPLADAVISWY